MVRGGEYFLRLKEGSAHTESDVFVFSVTEGNARLGRNRWHSHWSNLMRVIGVDGYETRKLTCYSLRHFRITCRIRAGNSYSEISAMAGTSASYIEADDKHYDDSMLKTAALKSFRIDSTGVVVTNQGV